MAVISTKLEYLSDNILKHPDDKYAYSFINKDEIVLAHFIHDSHNGDKHYMVFILKNGCTLFTVSVNDNIANAILDALK